MVTKDLFFQNFTCQICDSGFIEDVTIREDSPSSNSEHEESTYDDLDPMIGETIGVRNWLEFQPAILI